MCIMKVNYFFSNPSDNVSVLIVSCVRAFLFYVEKLRNPNEII
jgi:hypothetical protein